MGSSGCAQCLSWGFVDSRCGWVQRGEVADLFHLDFVDFGRGWAQRGIFRNCSPGLLLILNVVGHRRTFTRNNSLSARKFLEKKSRKTLQCPTAFNSSKNQGEEIKKNPYSAQQPSNHRKTEGKKLRMPRTVPSGGIRIHDASPRNAVQYKGTVSQEKNSLSLS